MGGNLVFRKQNTHSRYQKRITSSQINQVTKWNRNTAILSKKILSELYLQENKSMQEIADRLNCSLHKVAYWIAKHKIRVRSRSDATYIKRNPNGDPFTRQIIKTKRDAFLSGLGLGLYWGEGTKASKNSIRLGNADPKLIRAFIQFLTRLYGIERSRLRFGLQVFSDIAPEIALQFWCRALNMPRSQFQKVIITPSRGTGTYRKKLINGVLTVQFHNKKLRNVLIAELDTLKF